MITRLDHLDMLCFRLDRINEAEFRRRTDQHQQQQQQQTSFLWTIGPRPFWELWPHKRHKKKKLSLEEFIRCLLEHWARAHRYPPHLAELALPRLPATTAASAGTKVLELETNLREV